MKLALVSPLPPLDCRAAGAAARLAEAMSELEHVELHLCTQAPEQVETGLAGRFPIHPTANLPHLLTTGEVDVPIYMVDDNDHHAHQQRFQRECPGVEVRADAPEPVDAGALLRRAEKLAAADRKVIPDERSWPAVETVTVAYNSKHLIGSCLRALLDQDYPELKITIVDNASTDGTADYIREMFPDVNLVASTENLGFAGGNNLAFRRSHAKYVVLMNQDALARRDCIRELVTVAETDDTIAAVGAKMLMRRCPTIINSTGIRINEGGFAVDRQIGEKDSDPCPDPVEVFGVCGGAKLMRNETIRELGGFDEAFFMYFEDVDWCWRMRLAGRRILYAPLAVVHHDWHGDLDQPEAEADAPEPAEEELGTRTHRRRFLCERNRLQCLFKNYQLSSLFQVLPRLRRFERTRLSWCDDAIGRGENVTYFRMVKQAIRGAWRWIWMHLGGLWARRRRVQKTRRRTDAEVGRLIEPGVGEPSYIGDLEIIQDRFSVRAEPRIVMGKNDRATLGPGWYGAEPIPGQDLSTRWCKNEAFFYLEPDYEARQLHLRLAAGPVATDYRVWCGSQELGRGDLPDDRLREVVFDLPEPVSANTLLELRLSCSTFNPKATGRGEDARDLGLRMAEAWLA